MERLFDDFEPPKISRRHNKVTFKKYEMQQDFLFPPSTDDYLSKTHIARLINLLVDQMDISPILNKYIGGGTSAYHPSMMLKVWILGFVKKIYSSRKLEKALQENIAFMWISGRQTPDFKTLSNFRVQMIDDIKFYFKHFVQMGMEIGILEGKDIFIDHTKYQANANPYKMIWKKSVDKRLSNIDNELEILFKYIQELNEQEDVENANENLDSLKEEMLTKENIDKMISKINSSLKEGSISKEQAKEDKDKLRRTNELLERKKKALHQKELVGERSGCSRTDPDASAMKMKRSDEIKPCYNEGVATENGFIVSYDVSQNASDSVSFAKIVEEAKVNLEKTPDSTTADAGYGSFLNYEYLEKEDIKNFVKYPGWHRENKYNGKFTIDQFTYAEDRDSFTCLNDIELPLTGIREKLNSRGLIEKISIYSAPESACSACSKKPWCTEFARRNLNVNWELERFKNIVRENLHSEEGIEKRKRRAYEVETVFAHRKWNKENRRYYLRSLPKVNVEAGLHNISHNIQKIYLFIMQKIDPLSKVTIII